MTAASSDLSCALPCSSGRYLLDVGWIDPFHHLELFFARFLRNIKRHPLVAISVKKSPTYFFFQLLPLWLLVRMRLRSHLPLLPSHQQQTCLSLSHCMLKQAT